MSSDVPTPLSPPAPQRAVRRAAAMSRAVAGSVLGVPPRYDASALPELPGPTRTRFGRWFDPRPRVLLALTLLAIGWQVAYLVWRIGWSELGAASLVLGLALLVSELYGAISLTTMAALSTQARPSVRPPLPDRQFSVDVFVCTYDEPVEVLRPTLVGARNLTYPHATYLLDDGRRPDMAALAAELGAEYVVRPDNSHAKAGNINHALGVTSAELVFVLDADHVPLPDALDALVGYFADDRLALVQSPHDFYNHDSVQHYEVGRHEQSVFYEVICPGKDRHGAAFWCGSATLLRREALAEIGGVATETIAEDFHTTIKLLRRGWRTRYHGEVLVQGVGPHDLDGYLLQRNRWARGNLSVLHTPESPLRARELTAAARWSFAASLFGYGAGPARALALAVLAASLWTGALPVTASWTTIAVLWAPATLLGMLAGSALGRGHMRVRDAVHFELLTAGLYARAMRCLVRPSRMAFKVTPKAGTDAGGLRALRPLRLLLVLTVALVGGVLARVLGDLGLAPFTHLPALPGWAAWLLPVLAVLELRRVLRTIVVVARRRQRRAEFRFGCDEPALVITAPGEDASYGGVWPGARLRDASCSGLGLLMPAPVRPGSGAVVELDLPRLDGTRVRTRVSVTVRSCRPETVPAPFSDDSSETAVGPAASWRVGVTVVGGAPAAPPELVEFCYVTSPARRLRGRDASLPLTSVEAAVPSTGHRTASTDETLAEAS
ncbi:MAG: glycosyltransferase family 2 protein [Motilibacteraceae bacterium]